MSRIRFIVHEILPTINTDPEGGDEHISPTACHVELYRLDMNNVSYPLGKTWAHIDGVYYDYTHEVYQKITEYLVEQKLMDAPVSTEEDPLAELRAIRWGDIAAIRDGLETRGFPYLGVWFDSDERSVTRINTAAQAAIAATLQNTDLTVTWVTADNSTIDLTREQILGMPVAFALYGNELHRKARELRDRINAALSPEEIDACIWEGIEELPEYLREVETEGEGEE